MKYWVALLMLFLGGCVTTRETRSKRALEQYYMLKHHHVSAYCPTVSVIMDYRSQPELAAEVLFWAYRGELCPLQRAEIARATIRYGIESNRGAFERVIREACQDRHRLVRRATLEQLVTWDGTNAVPLLTGLAGSLEKQPEQTWRKKLRADICPDIQKAAAAAAGKRDADWRQWNAAQDLRHVHPTGAESAPGE
jgi:hypothetical protein